MNKQVNGDETETEAMAEGGRNEPRASHGHNNHAGAHTHGDDCVHGAQGWSCMQQNDLETDTVTLSLSVGKLEDLIFHTTLRGLLVGTNSGLERD